ncbi:hypothetical protein AVEN_75403-1 [Araneus ventricosus]|uniref:Uncharacterized protein n=1 Tax=Araneus ventricosus TaxID=182803 RepID=A0A4Y2J9X1_ARAVE|nr:hypothetical protein AVEN_75403-1 [Araneus ventricosus]
MSRFEATRGPYWKGPRNFEPRSDNEDDTLSGISSPNFPSTPAGGRFTHDVRFSVHQTHKHGGSSAESSFERVTLWTRSRDLPLGHHGLVS